jgi:YfiH family protein
VALIRPAWEAPGRVAALVTTRVLGDRARPEGRARLAPFLPGGLPGEPCWLKQVHGTRVVAAAAGRPEADAAFTRERGRVCAVMAADCMPVLFADRAGTVVAAAHAGWRGLCAGVLEASVAAMGVAPGELLAWLGPAIGPRAYEVGDEVRAAFVARDAQAASAFARARPGHWMLDLYAVAQQRLAAAGVAAVSGGGFCTHSESERFFSYRRDGGKERMAALIWLT